MVPGTFRGYKMDISGDFNMSTLNESAMLKRVLKVKGERSTNFKRHPRSLYQYLYEEKLSITGEW